VYRVPFTIEGDTVSVPHIRQGAASHRLALTDGGESGPNFVPVTEDLGLPF
jgi:hypothetical protein